MFSFAFIPLLAGLGYALPQNDCVTTTTEVVIPTVTKTWSTTDVQTVTATTPRDLGTFTDIVQLTSTKTLQTLTSTSTECTATGPVTKQPTTTVYTTAGASAPDSYDESSAPAYGPAPYTKRSPLEIAARQDGGCTVTETFTTTFGSTYEFYAIPSVTSTFTRYEAFTQATVTSTSSGFVTAYAIATATATVEAKCGPTANATAVNATTATVTQDARCAPSALTSEYNGYGLDYSGDTPAGGATFETNTTDASSCCQLCAEADRCAASSWDLRTGECKLEFPITYNTGELSCGQGMLVRYHFGPNHPMEPGTGLYVAEVCGTAGYASSRPDDGT
ncbi:hypothetical protein KC340_g9319 [Hortaea werneckii]|nr:hypothetical protein KC340_g9319 [Hortaea werneckii]KAI7375640.1 hypothetical protein KC328_g15312 [Hortaea werneckii]